MRQVTSISFHPETKELAMIDFVQAHKALIGTVIVAVGSYLTGALDLPAAIAAILAALSSGIKSTPAP
jgi:hypothetical protein